MKNKKNLGHLSPNQIHVTQEKGTEAPFTGELLYKKDAGTYTCVCCGNTLFSSDTKFDSGTGWPSFFDIENTDAVTVKLDESHGMTREEVVC
ncbi:MAG: peptide-methionine (R)-S-oxide reductase, partial [Gammaproteobacteria bacterium]|nr:peptide-methionine (R)-S-oxide reductase [Gammaproteobacteria bacterium]